MDAMEEKQLTKLSLKRGDSELVLEKVGALMPASPMFIPQEHAATHKAAAPSLEEMPVAEGDYITSPMVGTFYAAPAPDEPTFVKEGDRVSADTVVCIIEAMKVMNEVKAGQEGVITRILALSGNPVEYGTKLFEIQ